MTFEEWEVARDNSFQFAQKTIESMKGNIIDPEYAVTDEIREYNKNIMITLIEGDLYQIAAALNKIAETLPKAPEATSRERKMGHWHLLDECANEGWYCDQCHKKVFRADFSNTMKQYKFCPNCGAKMEA